MAGIGSNMDIHSAVPSEHSVALDAKESKASNETPVEKKLWCNPAFGVLAAREKRSMADPVAVTRTGSILRATRQLRLSAAMATEAVVKALQFDVEDLLIETLAEPIVELLSLLKRQKQRVVDATVEPGTISFTRTAKLVAAGVGTALQEVAGAAAGAALIGYGNSKFGNGKEDTRGNIVQATTTSVTNASTTLIKHTVQTVIFDSQLDERTAAEETYKSLKQSTTPEMLAKYPADTQAEVKALDQTVYAEIKHPRNTRGGDWFKQKIRHREEILLARPYESKDFTERWNDPILRAKFYADLDELVIDYPEINWDTIETLVQRIVANSVSENPSRVQVWLQGPGGVGKSRLVKLIADFLGAPLVEIRIPNKNIQDVLGATRPAAYAEPTDPDEEIIGELQMKLINAEYNNPILFIDEIKLTGNNLSDLKLLTENAKKLLKMGGYRANIDWSRLTIMMGSNDPLMDEAMQTRVMQVIIREASDMTKFKVATAVIDKSSLVYKNLISPEDYKILVSTCKNKIDSMIELDNKNFPGVRFLESASTENLVHFVAGGIMKKKPRTMDQITRYLEVQYAQAKGLAEPGAAPFIPPNLVDSDGSYSDSDSDSNG